jgi:uncharacterized membrane protein
MPRRTKPSFPSRWLVRLLDIWDQVRTSYWFLPAALVAVSVALAIGMVQIDEHTQAIRPTKVAWMYQTGADGARAVLGTIAGSMIGVAGVVFSITIVALSIAATQFGPHLLRNFMAKRTTQVALGTFLATFVYPLLVLRTVQAGKDDDGFVPSFSVLGAVVLTLISIAILIHFLHHIAKSIQVTSVASDVVRELRTQLDQTFAATGSVPDQSREGDLDLAGARRALCARRTGYVRLIDHDLLLRVARERDLRIAVRRGPGTFVVAGALLAEAGPASRIDDDTLAALQDGFLLGDQRTPIQDAAFSIDQLVDIAERALSPGVNDPASAIQSVHGLAAGFASVAARPDGSRHERDDDGVPRLRLQSPHFTDLVADSFDRILASAGTLRQVYVAMLDALALFAELATDRERLAFVRDYAERVRQVARSRLELDQERARIDEAVAGVLDAAGRPRAR